MVSLRALVQDKALSVVIVQSNKALSKGTWKQSWFHGVSLCFAQDLQSYKALSTGKTKQAWCFGVSLCHVQDVQSHWALSKSKIKQSWFLGVSLGLLMMCHKPRFGPQDEAPGAPEPDSKSDGRSEGNGRDRGREIWPGEGQTILCHSKLLTHSTRAFLDIHFQTKMGKFSVG